MNRAGSCAIIALLIDDLVYVANVGDSRAVMSSDEGAKITPLSRDHRPTDDEEQRRITNNGGKIYQ